LFGTTSDITVISAIIAGILSFLSPCVLPLVPSFITYLTGLSLAELQSENNNKKARLKIVTHSLLFIAGFTAVFVILGASATMAGGFLRNHMDIMRRVGGGLIILFGLHISGLIPIKFLLGEKRFTLHNKPVGYIGSVIVGIAFAAGWTPCIGPILASILSVAAMESKVYRGILLLFAYSMGLAIPFFLASLALNKFILIFNRFKKYIRLFEIITGILLVIAGFLIFFDKLNYIQKLLSY